MIRVAQRLGHALSLVVAVVALTFWLIELIPGDGVVLDPNLAAESMPSARARQSDPRPVGVRFAAHVGGALTGDLGVSQRQGRPVTTLIAEALPNTLVLSSVTLVVAQGGGLALGIFQARRRSSPADHALTWLTMTLYALPTAWVAMMLQWVFALKLGWLPASGMTDPVASGLSGWDELGDRLRHLLLPGVALGLIGAGAEARVVRQAMSTALSEPYIQAARSRGLSETRVVLHALRNALSPMITLLGLQLPFLLSGSVLVEVVFGWPGMGRLIVDAVSQQDTPVVLGCFLAYAVLVALSGALTDLLVSWADPRVGR